MRSSDDIEDLSELDKRSVERKLGLMPKWKADILRRFFGNLHKFSKKNRESTERSDSEAGGKLGDGKLGDGRLGGAGLLFQHGGLDMERILGDVIQSEGSEVEELDDASEEMLSPSSDIDLEEEILALEEEALQDSDDDVEVVDDGDEFDEIEEDEEEHRVTELRKRSAYPVGGPRPMRPNFSSRPRSLNSGMRSKSYRSNNPRSSFADEMRPMPFEPQESLPRFINPGAVSGSMKYRRSPPPSMKEEILIPEGEDMPGPMEMESEMHEEVQFENGESLSEVTLEDMVEGLPMMKEEDEQEILPDV